MTDVADLKRLIEPEVESLGYELVVLPRVSVSERVAFVLGRIA